MAYPVNFEVDYAGGTRSRGLAVLGIIYFLKGLALIPHMIVLAFLYVAVLVGAYIGYFVVAFTGTMPRGLFDFLAGVEGWYTRVISWLWANTDEYPPFALDAPAYPARFTAEYGTGQRSRGLAVLGIFLFLKGLAALPHLIIIGVLGYAQGIAAWVGFWIILFTGSLPQGIHDFVVGVTRWTARTFAWIAGLTDEYPPFSLA